MADDTPTVLLLSRSIDYHPNLRDRITIALANMILSFATPTARALLRDMYLRGYAEALRATVGAGGET